MQNRAYSVLQIKSINEDMRIIRGTATTPEPDRMGDIVEPLGVSFKNPLPLLWQHKHDQPVGEVRFDKPTKKGIEFTAKLAKSDTPGTLKDRLDEAWESIKIGLVKAVSIGFKAIEFSFLKETDGIHFLKTEVWELSLVTIPANTQANISAIKAVDSEALAASGHESAELERPQRKRPGVAGKQATRLEPKMKTIAEQIAAVEAKRAANCARMDELMAKAAEDGRVLESAEEEEYDTLKQENKNLDNHLTRLRDHAERMKETAKPAGQENEGEEQAASPAAAAAASGGALALREHQRTLAGSAIKFVKPKIEPGTIFVRLAMALMAGKGDLTRTREWVKSMPWNDQTPEVGKILETDPTRLAYELQQRAAIGVGTTIDATWASPLIAYTQAAAEFAEFLRPATIIGRIPGLRRVPFNIQVPRMTAGASVGWVGENAPKPVSSEAFDTITLRWAKAAGIVVLTQELMRFSNPAAEALVRADLSRAMAQFLDAQFVDPTVAAVTNVSPASITNGVTAVTPTGTTASAFRADVKTLLAPLLTANIPLDSGVWIMHTSLAISLSLMQNSLGQQVFPGMTKTGGTLLGFPVIASTNVPATGGSPADGYALIFAIADEIMLADDGNTVIDASDQASIQMDTAPDSPPSASTPVVSFWQMNFVGLRAERWINWQKRRTQAVQYMAGTKYAE
jgi:HK97 family phage prohead protease